MKTILNKKLTTITLTVLLSSMSLSVSAAQVTHEMKREMSKVAVQSIEQSMPSLIAEMEKPATEHNAVGQKKTLAELLLSISEKEI
ncbi:hypothetical protein KO495_12160 [Colwellia sp. D2M02]|uniref:hypothetical protein n=1 Tax=Colwellia sp. D2M02 TaxID=2841562 RepID=UPI001C08A3A8|nr:hypothetical protein [Colwellia sp. D2M02]MBU2894066.1 hypothetical protein [Colwellia sp. D2M02]